MEVVPSLAERPRAAHAAFAAFFTATWPDLSGYCTALLRDEAAAEEATQEALTRVFVRFPVLRDPRGYAFRVATNIVNDHWRARRRAEPAGMVVAPDRAVPSPADDPLLAAVRALPVRLRDVVLLHYYADLRIEDVAARLHRPVGTVKRRLHEARAALAALVEEDR